MLNPETKKHIDNARQVLVGKIPDPKSQIQQITNALIYKFMDDMDARAISHGGQATFFTGNLEEYSWSKIMDRSLGAQERINRYDEALRKFGTAKQLPPLFRTIFKEALLPFKNPETLNLFLNEITYFDYKNSEELGNAFEYLLSTLGTQGDAGQFRTPRHIIDFIIKVIDPKKTDTILDPACGTAGFLISAFKHIAESHDGVDEDGKPNDEKRLTPSERKKIMENITGYDISPDMVRLSLVNMYLHGYQYGLQNPNIIEYDTLSQTNRWDEKFDVMLANPPFMTPKGGIIPHNKFEISARRAEVLFVDYIKTHLKSNGRAGIIVPEGIIFQSSNSYKELRRLLVEDGLYAVVSLPTGVFNPYSGVKTSILFFDNTISKQTKKILFMKIENDGFDLGAQRRKINKNDLPRAVQILRDYKIDPSKKIENSFSAWVINKSKILESDDFSLAVERYKKTLRKLSQKWPTFELGEVCNIYNGATPKKSETKFWKNGTIPWFTVSDIRDQGRIISKTKQKITKDGFKKSSVKLLPKNSILLCCTASIGEFAFTEIELTTNQQFNGLVVKDDFREKLDPKFLFWLTSDFKEELERLSGKTSFSFISVGVLKKIRIPLPPIKIQREIVLEIEGKQDVIESAKGLIQKIKSARMNSGSILEQLDCEWIDLENSTINIIDGDRGLKYPNKEDFTGTGYCLFLNTKNVKSDGFDFEKLSFINEKKDNELRKGKLQREDIVLTTRGTLGNVSIYDSTVPYNHIRINSGMVILRPDQSEYLSSFLFFLFQSSLIQDQFRNLSSGSAQPQLPIKNLSKVKIPVLSINQQKDFVESIKKQKQVQDDSKELIILFESQIKNIINKIFEV